MQRRTKWIAGSALALAVIGGGTAAAMAGGVVGGNDDDAPLTGATLDRATEVALTEAGGGTVTESEHEDAGGYEVEVRMDDGTEVDVYLDDTFQVVRTENDSIDESDDDSDDVELTGAILDQATAAALSEAGGGTVTDSEQNRDGTYDVEVTLDDRSEVDVHLDAAFAVISSRIDPDD